MEYDNTNSGVLFKNKKKESDKHPDWKGNVTVTEPGEYWVSMWINTSKGGEKYMKLKLTLKDDQPNKSQSTPPAEDFEDDIPFN